MSQDKSKNPGGKSQQSSANNAPVTAIYGDSSRAPGEQYAPIIPAATVVLMRDCDTAPEVLMLRKNANISFGGMWVFPGGRIDDEDFVGAAAMPEGLSDTQIRTDETLYQAACNAAQRETREETGLEVDNDYIWLSHWEPPSSSPKRFSTWFFLAGIESEQDCCQEVGVDGQEILQHQWISPEKALQRHARGEIQLAPPTWMTLNHLSLFDSNRQALQYFQAAETMFYQTKIVLNDEGTRIALWKGDAGYHAGDANAEGDRHRLILADRNYQLQSTMSWYTL